MKSVKTINKQKIHVFKLITAVAIPLAVGVFSAFLTAGDMKMYETMGKPPLSPPAWIFPIAWTVLYIAMGVASYLILKVDADPAEKRKALTLYAVQLVMNMFWSTLFFTYSQYLISLIWLIAMWAVILVCTLKFFRLSRPAAYMMGALFLWTTFATYLNLGTWLISIKPVPAA